MPRDVAKLGANDADLLPLVNMLDGHVSNDVEVRNVVHEAQVEGVPTTQLGQAKRSNSLDETPLRQKRRDVVNDCFVERRYGHMLPNV